MYFSVLIPAYNCADSIADTVHSVLRSGLTEFEILIINDGSTDETASVLAELSSIHPNVKVLTQSNGGVSSARNLGLSHAQGEYIIFVDADDIIVENAYQHAAEIILKTRPDMLLFGMVFEYFHREICYQSEKLICPNEGLLLDDEWKAELDILFHCNYLSPVWNKFIRREIITQNKVHFAKDMFLMEDCLFSLDCLQYCHAVYLLSEPIYRYQFLDDGKKATARIRRIKSLNDYMGYFSKLPEEYSSVVRSIHHMLFLQRLSSAATAAEIETELREFRRSPFYEKAILPKQLINEHYRRYLLGNIKRRLRHKAAVAYKTARLHFMPRHSKTEME